MVSTNPKFPVLTGDTFVNMTGLEGNQKVSFLRLGSKAEEKAEEKWAFPLLFHGWSLAIHPPANVLAVSEKTGSASYVTSECNTDHAMLTNSVH